MTGGDNEKQELGTKILLRFWKHMIARHPGERRYWRVEPYGTRWHPIEPLPLMVSLSVGRDFASVFVRGDSGAKAADVRKVLEPAAPELEEALGVPLKPFSPGRFFRSSKAADMLDEAEWDSAADWLWQTSQTYEQEIIRLLSRS